MRGDFSRIPADRGRKYTAVLQQQGRVALDADANEQCLIDTFRSRAQITDAIGPFGGPAGDEGFAITVPDSNTIQIGAGRYYVNGLLCENPAGLSYDDQRYLVDPPASAASWLSGLAQSSQDDVLQVYLEVWQRFVTALDDPDLREPALGQADTTARLQTVWRVVAELVSAPQASPGQTGPVPSCCQEMYAALTPAPSTGTLTASLSGASAECGCEPVAAAGYQGLENQLYRVEIHHGSDQPQVTWKWSRENGSVVTAITKVSGSTVWVTSLGLDANLGFQAGQWVELTDDTLQFGPAPDAPGPLYQILSTPQLTDPNPWVTLAVPTGQTITVDPAANARMRRWDMSDATVTGAGLPLSLGAPVQLENGIQVTFGAPQSGSAQSTTPVFHSGDYWTMPARAATSQIEWPAGGSGGNAAQLPACVPVYRAPLACIHASVTANQAVQYQADDCRRVFSPLTTITPPVTPQAMHVTGISWVNDEVVTLDSFVTSGLTITLDQAPSSSCPLSGANVIVTVEPAQSAPFDGLNLGPTTNPRAPKPPVTNLRTVTVIDTAVTSDGPAITWQVPTTSETQQLLLQSLNTALYQGAPDQQWAKVRIRLLGQMIYGTGASGPVYLDGLAFGQPPAVQSGPPRIDLKLPSGTGVAASDFEGWLYVAPILQVADVSVDNPAVTVQVNFRNQVTGLIVTASSPAVAADLTATVAVNYPAIADTTVALTLSGSTGVGNIVAIPSTATIASGQTSVAVPISVLSNPGAGTTLSFTVTASINAQIVGTLQANATFTVAGVAPPPVSRGPVISE